MPINPSLDRGFTLTNFKWHLRANGHLKGEKIGACNYLKLSRIPVDVRLYWNKTNDRNTAFSLDELVRGFKIDERDEAGNAKTLNNVFLWSEGDIPQEPLSDLIELEYNGEGAMITPLLGNKSGAIDKIEKVSVVSTLDKIINPIKIETSNDVKGYVLKDFFRFNVNITQPILKDFYVKTTKEEVLNRFSAIILSDTNIRLRTNTYVVMDGHNIRTRRANEDGAINTSFLTLNKDLTIKQVYWQGYKLHVGIDIYSIVRAHTNYYNHDIDAVYGDFSGDSGDSGG